MHERFLVLSEVCWAAADVLVYGWYVAGAIFLTPLHPDTFWSDAQQQPTFLQRLLVSAMSRVIVHGIEDESMDAAENQLDALRHAMASYPCATHVLLLPGDAVPAVRTVDLMPTAGESLTGAVNMLAFVEEAVVAELYGDAWFTGPSWLQLSAAHAAAVLNEWPMHRQFFVDWHNDMLNDEHGIRLNAMSFTQSCMASLAYLWFDVRSALLRRRSRA